MTSPDAPSPTRPLRVVGMALLGLAVLALVIGLITVFGGGGADHNAQPSTSNGQPGSSNGHPPSSSTTRPSSSESSQPSSRPPTSSSSTRPSGPGGSVPTPPPGGEGNGEPGKTEPVRVYNNSTEHGLAARAADDLRAVGWNVVDVGNYPYSTVATTTVYYRPGTAEQQAAENIGNDFGMEVAQRIPTLKRYPAGVIVIVTNDYQGIGGKKDGK